MVIQGGIVQACPPPLLDEPATDSDICAFSLFCAGSQHSNVFTILFHRKLFNCLKGGTFIITPRTTRLSLTAFAVLMLSNVIS